MRRLSSEELSLTSVSIFCILSLLCCSRHVLQLGRFLLLVLSVAPDCCTAPIDMNIYPAMLYTTATASHLLAYGHLSSSMPLAHSSIPSLIRAPFTTALLDCCSPCIVQNTSREKVILILRNAQATFCQYLHGQKYLCRFTKDTITCDS